MFTGTTLMQRAGLLLHDIDHGRWTPATLCHWINDGLAAIALAKPSAHSETLVLSLAAGTRQSLAEAVPNGKTPIQLLDITRNLTGASSDIGGRVVKIVSRKALDAADPDWHNPTLLRQTDIVRQACFDEQDPMSFFVYPGNDGTGKVEAVVGTMPTMLEATGDTSDEANYGAIDIPDPYETPLLDWICYRAQSEDAPEGSAPEAMGYYQKFATALGIKIQVEGGSSPNRKRAEA